nr:MAG TPA: hypothetical protein [Inoviridae sp.]
MLTIAIYYDILNMYLIIRSSKRYKPLIYVFLMYLNKILYQILVNSSMYEAR